MEQYQLLIFSFKIFGEYNCLWPLFYDVSPDNASSDAVAKSVQAMFDLLVNYPGVQGVNVICNKRADIGEVTDTMEKILKTQPGDNSVDIKILEVEKRKVIEETADFDYGEGFRKYQVWSMQFPVRVRSVTSSDTLDAFMPLLVIEG